MALGLIYFNLLVFWLEKAFNLQLTGTTGLSWFNVSLYILLCAWLISGARKKRWIQPNNLNMSLVILMVMIVASMFIKPFFIPNMDWKVELSGVKEAITAFVLFFIVFNVINDERTCRRVLLALGLLVVCSVVAMLFVTYGMNIGRIHVSIEQRSAGFSEPNQYAAFLVLFIPLLLSSFLLSRVRAKKLVILIFCILVFAGLIVTGSRGGIISFLIVLAYYAFQLVKLNVMKLQKVVIASVVLSVIVTGAFVVAPAKTSHATLERVDPTQATTIDAYTSGRTWIWPRAFNVFLSSPLFGHGHNSSVMMMKLRYRMAVNTHNDYLTYIIDYGLIGLFIYLAVFFKIFRYIRDKLSNEEEPFSRLLYVSYLAGFLAYLLTMFGVNIIEPKYPFWIYTATVYKYSILREQKPR